MNNSCIFISTSYAYINCNIAIVVVLITSMQFTYHKLIIIASQSIIAYDNDKNPLLEHAMDDAIKNVDDYIIRLNKLTDDKILENHIEFVEDRPFNDFRYSVDTTLLKSLGWEELFVNFNTNINYLIENRN